MNYTLEQLDHAYHTLGQPLVSDADYDRIAGNRSKVGSAVESGAKRLPHLSPMLSISSKRSIDSFGRSTQADLYLAEPKIDGVAISLDYVNGLLSTASTRGNGKEGRDVTRHALACSDIPNKLNDASTITVRGEMFVPLDKFKDSNFSTSRNAVVGSLRLKDSSEFARRPISFYAFQIVDHSHDSQIAMMKDLSRLGLLVNPEHALLALSDIPEYFARIESGRKSFNYDMDGIVLKVNSVALQYELGCSSTSPNWAMAKKFAAATTVSEIVNIEYGKGKSGRRTAVAHIKPVQLLGKTISKINLYNPQYVSEIGAGVGSSVLVQMTNDVIASLKSVLTQMPYSGPELPNKHTIGPVISVDLDEIYALLK